MLLGVSSDEMLLLENKRDAAVVEWKKSKVILKARERKYARVKSLADTKVLASEVAEELGYELETFRLDVELKKLAVDRVELEMKIAKKR